jgi:hypothetical protein
VVAAAVCAVAAFLTFSSMLYKRFGDEGFWIELVLA